MAKREIPLFLIDTSRTHKKGECDFIVCTDQDCGFVGKIDYVDGNVEEVGDDCRIGYSNGDVSVRLQVLRMTGKNQDKGKVRTLIKKGLDYYVESVQRTFKVEKPSRQDCIDYLNLLVRANRHSLDELGSDFQARKTALTSLNMLISAADYLKEDL